MAVSRTRTRVPGTRARPTRASSRSRQTRRAPARVAIRGLGAYHAAELLFLFGTSHPLLGNSSSAPELGPAMRGYWSRFASTGDPRGTPAWPVWSPTSDQRLHLSAVIDIETGYLDAVCDFWDTIYDTL